MKAYWLYTCDYGHEWVFFRDEESEENPEDVLCPFGHEAVTLQKRRMLDMVQVAIRPAAQIVDTCMEKGDRTIAVQVGRATKGRLPIARERSALSDLRTLDDFDHVFFIEY